jgi:hypothetical protein
VEPKESSLVTGGNIIPARLAKSKKCPRPTGKQAGDTFDRGEKE